jgi:hypothetical protein
MPYSLALHDAGADLDKPRSLKTRKKEVNDIRMLKYFKYTKLIIFEKYLSFINLVIKCFATHCDELYFYFVLGIFKTGEAPTI